MRKAQLSKTHGGAHNCLRRALPYLPLVAINASVCYNIKAGQDEYTTGQDDCASWPQLVRQCKKC